MKEFTSLAEIDAATAELVQVRAKFIEDAKRKEQSVLANEVQSRATDPVKAELISIFRWMSEDKREVHSDPVDAVKITTACGEMYVVGNVENDSCALSIFAGPANLGQFYSFVNPHAAPRPRVRNAKRASQRRT